MNTKIAAKNAKSAANAATFEVGQTVTVCNAKTGDQPCLGIITAIAKGWYVLDTHDHGKVSARISSLTPLPATPAKKADKAAKKAAELAEKAAEMHASSERVIAAMLETEEVPETPASLMAKALREARAHYTRTKRPDGTASADCADIIAKELRDLEPLEVAALADRCLNVAKGTHEKKYGHLNAGQIRMNSGNRIRAAWKAAHESGDEAAVAHLKFVMGLDGEEEDESGK